MATECVTHAEIERGIEEYADTFPVAASEEAALTEELSDADHVTKEQLVRIIEWKLAGQPGRAQLNVDRASSVPNGVVEDVSRGALDSAESPKLQLKILNALPGVGYATASVLLAFWNPEEYAIGDRVINEAVLGKDEVVTPSNYRSLLEELHEMKPPGCSLRSLEKALYVRHF